MMLLDRLLPYTKRIGAGSYFSTYIYDKKTVIKIPRNSGYSFDVSEEDSEEEQCGEFLPVRKRVKLCHQIVLATNWLSQHIECVTPVRLIPGGAILQERIEGCTHFSTDKFDALNVRKIVQNAVELWREYEKTDSMNLTRFRKCGLLIDTCSHNFMISYDKTRINGWFDPFMPE